MTPRGFFRTATALSLTFAGLLGVRAAEAATCSYIKTGDLGDDYMMWDAEDGWKCQQNFIDYWWDAFNFDKEDWDDGFGYSEPCNNAQPLARTFNGLYALGYSATNAPHCDFSSIRIVDWAMCWAAANTDELDGRCGSGSASGTGAKGSGAQNVVGDCWTQLYWPFFYGSDVGIRAATLFHEARHTGGDGCGHNGGSRCKAGSSCDKSWTDGCEERANRAGAIRYQVLFHENYAFFAWRTTTALRDSAIARANVKLSRNFVTDPCLRMSSNGLLLKSC